MVISFSHFFFLRLFLQKAALVSIRHYAIVSCLPPVPLPPFPIKMLVMDFVDALLLMSSFITLFVAHSVVSESGYVRYDWVQVSQAMIRMLQKAQETPGWVTGKIRCLSCICCALPRTRVNTFHSCFNDTLRWLVLSFLRICLGRSLLK